MVPRVRGSVSPHPHAVRPHDIDADGHAHLLVDDRSPESIRLFRAREDGKSSGATSIDVGGDPYGGMSRCRERASWMRRPHVDGAGSDVGNQSAS